MIKPDNVTGPEFPKGDAGFTVEPLTYKVPAKDIFRIFTSLHEHISSLSELIVTQGSVLFNLQKQIDEHTKQIKDHITRNSR